MKLYYMVLCPETNYTRFRHESYKSAKDEAIRLANQYQGKEFVVLAAIATVKKADVIVDEVPRADDIPF